MREFVTHIRSGHEIVDPQANPLPLVTVLQHSDTSVPQRVTLCSGFLEAADYQALHTAAGIGELQQGCQVPGEFCGAG